MTLGVCVSVSAQPRLHSAHRISLGGESSALYLVKVKVKVAYLLWRCLYVTRDQKRFTISEVAADWHELMIPQRIMRPPIARASEQLDPRCSTQTYRSPNQPHKTFAP